MLVDKWDNLLRAARGVIAEFEAVKHEQYEKLTLNQTLESASENWGKLGRSVDFQPLMDAVAAFDA